MIDDDRARCVRDHVTSLNFGKYVITANFLRQLDT